MIHKIGFYFCHMSKWKINDFRNLCPKFGLQTFCPLYMRCYNILLRWLTQRLNFSYIVSIYIAYFVSNIWFKCCTYLVQTIIDQTVKVAISNLFSKFWLLRFSLGPKVGDSRFCIWAKLKKSHLPPFDPRTFGRVWIRRNKVVLRKVFRYFWTILVMN